MVNRPAGSLILLLLIATAIAAPQNPPAAPALSHIEGVVVDDLTGKPVEGVLVSWRPAIPQGTRPNPSAVPVQVTSITDNQGTFSLSIAEPGEVRLFANKPGYVGKFYNFSVKPGDVLRTPTIRLISTGVIAGRVSDAAGRPIANANVMLYTRGYSISGDAKLDEQPWVGRTNDRGEYRVADVFAGKYLVAINAPAMGSTLYPGVRDISKAIPIEVGSAGETKVDNMVLIPPPTTKVRVHIFNTTGELPSVNIAPGTGLAISSVYTIVRSSQWSYIASPVAGPNNRDLKALPAASEYRTEFNLAYPGKYEITAGWKSADGNEISGFTTVNFTGAEMDVELLVQRQDSNVIGRVMLEQTDGPPLPLFDVSVSLRRNESTPYSAFTDRSGNFLMPTPVAAGIYELGGLSRMPSGAVVIVAQQGDRDVLKDGLRVSSGTNSLEIRVSTASGAIQGKVTDRTGNAVRGALVAVVPEAPLRDRLDKDRTFRSATSDEKGVFEIQAVIPGTYRLYAWHKGEAGAIRNAEFMKPFEAAGTALVLEKSARITANVTTVD